MEGEVAFTCCRSTVEVWRCGHTSEHPLQCQWHFPAGSPLTHIITHRIRIDRASPCAACVPGVVALQFQREGPLQDVAQGPAMPLYNNQANVVNPYNNAQRRTAMAANQPTQGRETTEESAAEATEDSAAEVADESVVEVDDESVVETTESDEPEDEAEEEEPPTERYVAPNLRPRDGRRTRRDINAQKRDEKMQREFAEKPYRARGGRGQ